MLALGACIVTPVLFLISPLPTLMNVCFAAAFFGVLIFLYQWERYKRKHGYR
jgi:hypothetical protein